MDAPPETAVHVTRLRLLLGILAMAALAAWGIERLVVTDAEAVEALLAADEAAIRSGDWDTVRTSIAPEYEERGRDREAIVRWARDLWKASRATTLSIRTDDVRVEGDRAAARVTVSPGSPWTGQRFGGRVDLERTPEGWRIVGIAPDDARFLGR